MTWSVRNTPELRRILDLPRRGPQEVDLVKELTEVLKTAGGTMSLRANQALALHDLAICGGLFGPLGVGEGKTLLTLLAAYVLDAKRPLLLIPANLREKTERDRAALSKHWLIPKHLRVMSVEMLGRVQSAKELDIYKPDLIIVDEAHKFKNRRAACTRRVARYMDEHPDTKFVALSGTIMRRSLMEFGHLLRWCLKTNAPIPCTAHELEEWASALDEYVGGRPGNELARFEPGALLMFSNAEDRQQGPLKAARLGFQRRLTETPGVVTSGVDGEYIGASIHISARQYSIKGITEAHFKTLRTKWETPDGWPLSSGADIWRHAKELALGLHYVWSPRPPKDWMDKRREWASFVREVLSRSRTLDSELQVAQAVAAGRIDDGGRLVAWQGVRDTFTPNTVPMWHDDSALKFCANWMEEAPGIVWSEHAFFARRLSEETCIPYFGAKGLTAGGQFIDDADPRRSAIVSVDANREGRNLQTKWSRNLIVSPPEGADIWQQVIGRTHRTGQTADEVIVDVLLGCAEHAAAWRKAIAGAAAIKDTTGQDSKLLLADVEWPADAEIARWVGARWGVQTTA